MADTPAPTDKRSAILTATLELVAEKGFHAAPVSQIAKRSGVSAGMIYHFFDDKDDLIHALYLHVKGQFLDALMVDDPGALPYPDHLIRIWLNAFHFHLNNPSASRFLEQYENSPYGQARLAAILDWSPLATIIEADTVAGYIRPMPFDMMYPLTLGIAVGLARSQLNGLIHLNDDDLDTIARGITRSVAPLPTRN